MGHPSWSTQLFPNHRCPWPNSPLQLFQESTLAWPSFRDPQELQRTTAATSPCYSGSTLPLIDCNTLQGISVDCHCALSPLVFSRLDLDTLAVFPGVTASPLQRELALGPSQPCAFFFFSLCHAQCGSALSSCVPTPLAFEGCTCVQGLSL